METKQTAMQIMLSELKLKQSIYEASGMYESATALVTSIEAAKELIAMEKEQMIDMWMDGNTTFIFNGTAEQYYSETYGKQL